MRGIEGEVEGEVFGETDRGRAIQRAVGGGKVYINAGMD